MKTVTDGNRWRVRRRLPAVVTAWKCLLLAACLTWLGGCLVGPNYHRPKVETPQGWRFSEQDARDVADTDWWQQFDDPVLNALIATALRDNMDLRIAAARVEQFRGRLAIVRSPLFPQVSAGASAGAQRSTQRGPTPLSAATANPTALYQANLSASWELDLWGKVRRSTESARADLLASEEGKRGVILSLVAEVAAGYVNLLDLDRQLEIATRTAKSREEYYRIFTLRFNAGYVSNLELSQVRSEYEGALATIPAIEKEISQQEDALSLLLGHNPGPIQRGRSIDTLGLPAVPAGLPSQLLERRPDIRQAEQQLISANAQIGAARAQFFPSISLTGLFGWESTNLAQLFTGPARMWSFAAPIAQPIFNAGAITGGVKVAEAAREEALFNYQKVIQSGFRDVEDALIDQRRSREQLAAQTSQVESLQLYSSTARLRYENGYTSYLEVLDAERSLFDAELGAARTKGVLLQALINLYKAMGGGWVARAEAASGAPR